MPTIFTGIVLSVILLALLSKVEVVFPATLPSSSGIALRPPTFIQSVSAAALKQADSKSLFIGTNYTNNNVYGFPLADVQSEGQYIGMGKLAVVGDFDNDKFCEVLTVTDVDRKLRWYETIMGVSNTEFVVSEDAYPENNFSIGHDVTTGDFDGNGFTDFAFGGRSYTIQIHLNQGDMTFKRVMVSISDFSTRAFERISSIDNGDFNNDGIEDLSIQHYWNAQTNHTPLV